MDRWSRKQYYKPDLLHSGLKNFTDLTVRKLPLVSSLNIYKLFMNRNKMNLSCLKKTPKQKVNV